jgi:ApbE superfamily uncharacterized protein (UPF0280 family)
MRALADGSVVVAHGPMNMTIKVWQGARPSPELAKSGGRIALNVLRVLTEFLPILRANAMDVRKVENLPSVVQRMIRTTQSLAEPGLTSMASVAGAAADEVADFLKRLGGSRIVVNNGGDIALRLRIGEEIRIGTKTNLPGAPSHVFVVEGGQGIGGVATSGLGGRSLTKGIASAAVAIASSATMADAAATVLGNATSVDHRNIRTELAEKICPNTDIPGQKVVTHVGRVPRRKIEEAFEKGLNKAELLVNSGLIMGAIIAIKGEAHFSQQVVADGRRLHLSTQRH